MLDIREIRKDPAAIERKLRSKVPETSLSPLLAFDEKLRLLKTELEQWKAERNALSKTIGTKKQKGEDASAEMAKVQLLAERLSQKEPELLEVEAALQRELSLLPNLPMEEIPIGSDPRENVCLKSVGEKPSFSFPTRNHVELNEKLHLFDFPRGAKITGSGWPLYKGMGARLEWALLNYMLDIHRKNGFTQIMPPLLVQEKVMYGAGQLPKFKNQLFHLEDTDYPLYLIPTAEAPLTGLHSDEILEEEVFPLLYTAYTPCFRREAGAAGSQERGLIRTHQFNKVELYALTRPEESAAVYEKLLASAEEVLQGLELHYRTMLLVTGDMSFASAKTIDIEVWLPGQNRYYEVSSVSNCTDYQARRAEIRYRKGKEKLHYVHTLNGSGLATSRLMVALLENFQRADGSVPIPRVLHPYLKEEIKQLSP
ncbi:MAG: serine--tRNA ligase [Verrucomicrobiota bacterium]|nr:serine--tRNA ligase [Verrucomicrobiota bacterium]